MIKIIVLSFVHVLVPTSNACIFLRNLKMLLDEIQINLGQP